MKTRALAAALSLVLVVAACGGDDDAADTDDATTTTAAEDSTTGGDAAGDDAADDEAEADDEAAAGDGAPVPSSGCGTGAGAATEVERVDTTSGGVDRWYLLTAPESEEPLPLVVDLHGFMEGAEIHAVQSDLGAFGLEEGFVTAFPNGTGDPVQWQVGSVDTPDVAFVDTMVEEVTSSRCIDTSRIYATGLSMGAMMTSILACTRADTFAAFAPVNGIQLPDGCDPSRPVPMLTFHGTADPILLFNGGVDTSSFTGGEPGAGADLPEADLDGEGYPATLEGWAEVQGCTDPVDVEEPPVVERSWTCPDGGALEFVIVEGQGHGWPGSVFAEAIAEITGPQVPGVDANERIWEFFQAHQLPAS